MYMCVDIRESWVRIRCKSRVFTEYIWNTFPYIAVTAARTLFNYILAVIQYSVFKIIIKKYEGLKLLFLILHRCYIQYYLLQVLDQLIIHHEQVSYLLQGILYKG